MAGTRGYQDIVEPFRADPIHGPFVMVDEEGLLAVHFPKVLEEDLAEGIVIVDEESFHSGRRR